MESMKIKVGVFFGGNSVEHEISVISALQAIRSMDTDKYDIVPVYITRDNKFYCGEKIGKIENYSNIKELLNASQQVILVKGNHQIELYKFPFGMFSNKPYDHIDIAFPIVHGTNVEDGALQGFLQYYDVPVVGCDVLSSAVGMDKYVMKMVLQDEGVPVLDGMRVNVFEYEDDEDGVLDRIEKKFSYPVIVKPINLGSSVGIKIGRDRAGLLEAVKYAFEYSTDVLIERAVTNLREINCAVLGDMEGAIASECEEPFNSDEILSYQDKYLSTGASKGMASVKRQLPADIPAETREEIRTIAVKAFKALRCNGTVRIDFMIDGDENKVYVNEVNTIPGSLAFYLWKASGIEYKELLTRMIQLALKRMREKNAISFEYDTNILNGYSFGGSKGDKFSGGKLSGSKF